MKIAMKMIPTGLMILVCTLILDRNCTNNYLNKQTKHINNLVYVCREAERLQDGGQGTSQGTYSDSLLLIEGVETQGLFNWLLNSKLCLSNTGPLTGIPPTLFSPVAFHQATLRPLKVPCSQRRSTMHLQSNT